MSLRLGQYTLDVDARQLLLGGVVQHLSPKAFDLLRMLVEHRPRVLSKQELQNQLWPATFVAESNLAGLVAELRDALGDSARQPQFVRTAHRVGYAFCGDAIEAPDLAARAEATAYCWLLKDGRRLPLQPGENVLGRDDDGVQVDSPTVSRRHACIRLAGDRAVIEDLGSKNGSFVGRERVSSAVTLRNGDEIRIGSVVFRFRMTLPKGETATWSGRDPAS